MEPNQPTTPPVPSNPTEPQAVVTNSQPSPKSKYTIPFAIGGVVLVVIVAVVAGILLYGRNKEAEVSNLPAFKTLTPIQTYPVVFEKGSDISEGNGSQSTAVIKLPDGGRVPTAFHLEIDFDPQLVTIDSIKAGGMWEQANDLNTKIENGKLIYDAGQGFGTEHTGSYELAVITYTPKSTRPFQFTIADGSRLGFVRENQLSPIQGATLTITP